MAISNSIENFSPITNPEFVKKADTLTPTLFESVLQPLPQAEAALQGERKIIPFTDLQATALKKGDIVCLDFGEHIVGYFSFTINTADVPADAPAYLRIKFAEQPEELAESCADYSGQLSSSWLQEERLHIDEIPSRVDMPRRYAFRYVEIEVLDTSPCYRICLKDAQARAVSAVKRTEAAFDCGLDGELAKIDRISLLTARECMQEVVEDGPKRDRRLWIGDLRLAALVNSCTFENYDLIKRCLYLFAGLRVNRGQVGACLYVKPDYKVGDVALFDYSLFFVSCLYDYYEATQDVEVLGELWDTAYRQIELACERLDENDVVRDSDDWWSFIDWNDDLNKQAGSQAIFIYAVKQAIAIAGVLGDTDRKNSLSALNERLIAAAMNHLWDENKGFFISGEKRQVSWASQVWFVLAGVLDVQDAKLLMNRLKKENPSVTMVTPYMYHHYAEALLICGMKNEAEQCIREYWGGMVRDGANCFYEIYNPKDKSFSPYGSSAINSYCHIWSATPAYLFRKYFR